MSEQERKIPTFWIEVAAGERDLPRPKIDQLGWVESFLAALTQGCTIQAAADAAKVPIGTVHGHRARNSGFNTAVAAARRAGASTASQVGLAVRTTRRGRR